MDNDELLGFLEDPKALMDAYAASSAYVLRKFFTASKKLQAFTGRTDLAPSLLEELKRQAKNLKDPVKLGALLYALELTGASREIRAGALHVLRNKALRDEPLAGQFACQIGARIVGFERETVENYFEPDERQRVYHALEVKEGDK
jgi:hypothetical protein